MQIDICIQTERYTIWTISAVQMPHHRIPKEDPAFEGILYLSRLSGNPALKPKLCPYITVPYSLEPSYGICRKHRTFQNRKSLATIFLFLFYK